MRADEKLTAFVELERLTCNDRNWNEAAPLGLGVEAPGVEPVVAKDQAIDYAQNRLLA